MSINNHHRHRWKIRRQHPRCPHRRVLLESELISRRTNEYPWTRRIGGRKHWINPGNHKAPNVYDPGDHGTFHDLYDRPAGKAPGTAKKIRPNPQYRYPLSLKTFAFTDSIGITQI